MKRSAGVDTPSSYLINFLASHANTLQAHWYTILYPLSKMKISPLLSWLAINGVIVHVEKIMRVIVKT